MGRCVQLVRIVMPVLFLFMTSCKPTVPSEYIQPEEMEDILYDYHMSQAMAYQKSRTESHAPAAGNNPVYNRNLYYHAVLKKHGVTEAEFDSSLVYYYTRADKLHKIYKRVSERMEKYAISLGANVSDINKYSQFNAEGDTANIWRGITSTVLTPAPPYNRLDFKIDGDSTFRKGDSFLFNFMTDFIYQGGTKDAVIYIAVRYDNDSISTHISHVSVSGLSQLRVPENVKNDIKEINGFVYLNRGNDESNTLKLMFINQIQLIRFHRQGQPESADSIQMETEQKDSVTVIKPDTSQKVRRTIDTVHNSLSNRLIMKRMAPKRGDDGRETQKSGRK